MDMKKNEKGSSLIFAVVVIMVLSIVIAAALAISYTYYNRSIANNSQRQAYLTAKSVLTNVVDNINTTDYSALIPTEIGSAEYDISDFPTELGEVDKLSFLKNLEKDENQKDIEKITISVSATYGGKQGTMNADLKRYEKENWQLIKYYDGNIIDENNISKANKLWNDVSPILNFAKAKDKQGLIEYLNKSSSETGIIFKDTNCYNNDQLLKYLNKVLFKDEVIELNKSEFKLPEKHKLGDKFYLHIMFGFQQSKEWFVIYANATASNTSPGWQPTLVYLPETQHWYYNIDSWGNNKFPNMASINSNYETGKQVLEDIKNACTPDNIAQ